MSSNRLIGYTDGDTAALAEIIADIEKTHSVIAAAQAAQTRALARAGDLARTQAARSRANVRDHDMALRGIAAEVAGVLRATDRSVQRQIGDATVLVEDYPATLQVWEHGAITRAHVRVITETGAHLPPEARGAFETDALRRCAVETPGRVRGELELLAEKLHPRTLTERHADACAGRMVRIVPVGDGMSDLHATMPTLLADAIYDRLTQQARAVADARAQAAEQARAAQRDAESAADDDLERLDIIASDTRTTDQLRLDILTDTLLTAAPDADPTRTDDTPPGRLGAIRGTVQIIVPALTLLGVEDTPVNLVGRSPIDPDTARQLAATTTTPWERILTHPVTGTVLCVDTYQRTTAINRHLRARDQHCRFPGRRLPTIHCDVDHTIDAHNGGPTHLSNLAHLCRRHHSMKHHTAWKVTQLPGGTLRWTSPLGRTYDDTPPPLGVHFTPGDRSDDPLESDRSGPSDDPPTDTQHNDAQPDDVQHNDAQHSDTPF